LQEQSGLVEEDFKKRLIDIFKGNLQLQTAYLCQVRYERESGPSVALCLRGTTPDQKLVGRVAEIFSSMFSQQTHLDIIFIDASQESQLSEVCRPFYCK